MYKSSFRIPINHKKIQILQLILGLLLFSPIFISITTEGSIVLDRFHYVGEDVYKFTFPVSIVIALLFIVKNIVKIFSSIEITLFFTFLTFATLTNMLTSDSLGYLAVIFKTVFFILILYSLERDFEYHNRGLYQVSPYKLLMLVLIVTLVSAIMYGTNIYYYLIKQFAIYNFFQYYTLVFILLLGICAEKRKFLIFSLTSVSATLLSIAAGNSTSLILSLAFSLFYIVSLLLNNKQLKQFSVIIIYCCICFVFLYYFMSILLKEDLSELAPDSFAVRIAGLREFFYNVEWSDFIFPVQFDKNIPSDYYHNESLSLLSTLGLLGTIFFYLIILNKIIQINNYFPHVAVAISLLVFIAGITVLPVFHPYTGIILAYVISHYIIKIRIKNIAHVRR